MSILRTEILHLIVLIKNFHQLLQYYHPEENLLIVLDLPALISICKNSTLFCNVHSILLSAFDLRNQWKNGQSFDSLYRHTQDIYKELLAPGFSSCLLLLH